MIKKNEIRSEYQVAEKKIWNILFLYIHFLIIGFESFGRLTWRKSRISLAVHQLEPRDEKFLQLWTSGYLLNTNSFGDLMQDKMSIKVFLIAPTRLS